MTWQQIKPAALTRPRTLKKLAEKYDLRPGDTVELRGWQDGSTDCDIGKRYTVNHGVSDVDHADGDWFHIPSPHAKGERPLFVIVGRAGFAMQIKTIRTPTAT